MIVDADQELFSIVILGNFNPSIFQPLWFSANDLMAEAETAEADIGIIHRQLAAFSIGGVKVEVDDSRLALTALESQQGLVVRDLAIGTLSILEHTPLTAVGLNCDLVYSIANDEMWHEIGNRLVPKEDWKEVLDSPEMGQLVVVGKRKDCHADRISIRVQPRGNRKVLVAVNQHYDVLKAEDGERSVQDCHEDAKLAIQEDWHSFNSHARNAANIILRLHSELREQES